jgi:hypothetical protein
MTIQTHDGAPVKLAASALVILLNTALLLHQLGGLGERFAARSRQHRVTEEQPKLSPSVTAFVGSPAATFAVVHRMDRPRQPNEESGRTSAFISSKRKAAFLGFPLVSSQSGIGPTQP